MASEEMERVPIDLLRMRSLGKFGTRLNTLAKNYVFT